MQSDSLYPGVCDFHVHVGERIGGLELRDDFAALDKTARRQGIAAIGAFVTEEPGQSLTDKYLRMQADARQHFGGHVHWHLTPTSATAEELLPLLEEGCDLKFYTTYKQSGIFSSYVQIGRWMEALADPKPRFLVHCEDDATIEKASRGHPFRTPFDHTLRRPEIAEVIAVEKVLDLALRHQHPVHIVHVSTPRAALLIREAKLDNPLISCETAPQYLFHSADRLRGRDAHRWLCTPPYRAENSRGQLVELLQDGVFDILASDHCPFTDADKDRHKDSPELVPSGIPGLESLFASGYRHLVQTGRISLERLVGLCCLRPAELMQVGAESRCTLERLLGEE